MISENLKKNIVKMQFMSYFLVILVIFISLVLALTLENKSANATVPNPAIFTKSGINSTTHAVADWDMLDEQFVDQLGDTMGGDLDMGGNTVTGLPNPVNNNDIANKSYTDMLLATLAGAAAQDVDGNPLRVYCDVTPSNGWIDTGYLQGVYRTVITQGGGGPNFSATPIYLYSVGGDSGHVVARTNAIFNANNTDFQARIFTTMSPALANSRHMHIIWCGIGN